jgi:hypothetical protein
MIFIEPTENRTALADITFRSCCPECGAETMFSVYELRELLADDDFCIEEDDFYCVHCANRALLELRELHR